MPKIRVLIIEDDPQQAASLQDLLIDKAYEVIAIATNLKDALGIFYSQKPDIIIIDIYLDGNPDGIVFAERINENPTTLRPFIFLTSAIDRTTFDLAKHTNPHSYLVKPFNSFELQYAMELALEKFTNAAGTFTSGQPEGSLLMQTFFLVKKKDVILKIYFDSIEFIHVEGKYATIKSTEDSFLIEMSLQNLLQKLPAKHFIQIHRNYAINLNRIKKLHLADDTMELESGKCISISRRFKEQFTERYVYFK